MKSLIVYYSDTHNTKYVAEMAAEKLGADTLRLETAKPAPKSSFLRMMIGGFAAMVGMKPELKTYTCNPDAYELIILGTPLWAGKAAAPLNTFLAAHPLTGKKVAIFVTSDSGDAEGCLAALRKRLNVVATASLRTPLQRQAETAAKVDGFAADLMVS